MAKKLHWATAARLAREKAEAKKNITQLRRIIRADARRADKIARDNQPPAEIRKAEIQAKFDRILLNEIRTTPIYESLWRALKTEKLQAGRDFALSDRKLGIFEEHLRTIERTTRGAEYIGRVMDAIAELRKNEGLLPDKIIYWRDFLHAAGFPNENDIRTANTGWVKAVLIDEYENKSERTHSPAIDIWDCAIKNGAPRAELIEVLRQCGAWAGEDTGENYETPVAPPENFEEFLDELIEQQNAAPEPLEPPEPPETPILPAPVRKSLRQQAAMEKFTPAEFADLANAFLSVVQNPAAVTNPINSAARMLKFLGIFAKNLEKDPEKLETLNQFTKWEV